MARGVFVGLPEKGVVRGVLRDKIRFQQEIQAHKGLPYTNVGYLDRVYTN